jgi:hypothetical protein
MFSVGRYKTQIQSRQVIDLKVPYLNYFKTFLCINVTGQNLALVEVLASFEKRKQDRDGF